VLLDASASLEPLAMLVGAKAIPLLPSSRQQCHPYFNRRLYQPHQALLHSSGRQI
jgi:hypothetical protein